MYEPLLVLLVLRGVLIRGGKIGPARWASPVHPELGPGWAGPLNYWPEKNLAKFGSAQYGPTRLGLPEFFLPSKGYLARPARFLGRVGLLKFWPKKSGPILARPCFGPAQPSPARPARLPALVLIRPVPSHHG